MEDHTEKTPIDDLFARKLGDMALPPSPNGFDRLQAKMGRHKPETRIGIWRNPAVQRYTAVAASLVLVCVLGWLYWPTDQEKRPMAANPPALSSPQKLNQQTMENDAPVASLPIPKTPGLQNQQEIVKGQVAITDKSSDNARRNGNPKAIDQNKATPVSPVSGSALAVRPAKQMEAKVEVVNPDVVIAVDQQTQRLAENTSPARPTPAVERGLVVTISEPEALMAARQAVKTETEEKPVVATNDKSEKETKGNSLWQQVKRIKQGDVFARENSSDAESSLIGRAYNGLKHNFDKDKSAKQ